jgi:hypothetical protein
VELCKNEIIKAHFLSNDKILCCGITEMTVDGFNVSYHRKLIKCFKTHPKTKERLALRLTPEHKGMSLFLMTRSFLDQNFWVFLHNKNILKYKVPSSRVFVIV